MSLAAAALLVCLAQAPRPSGLSLPSFRLSVLASEDLDPDRLRPLAHPGVTLWLSTRSNTLRESTVENLARFSEAWVRLRAPLTRAQAHGLIRAPRAGALLAAGDLGGEGLYLLGPRRLAVELTGALDESGAAQLAAARPKVLFWEPPEGVDLLAFALFRQLPGRKIVRLAQAPSYDSGSCRPGRGPPAPSWWVDTQATPAAEPPCGQGLRARVSSRISDEALLRLYRLDPAVELEVWIGADDKAASGARALLSRLEQACPHAP